MANFKRTIWESRLVENYNEISDLHLLTTAPTEMDGQSITFNRVGAGTVSQYEGSINWEDIDTEPVSMTFEHKYYFAGKIDDIDKAQTNLAIVDAFAADQVAEMSTKADTYTYAKYVAGAGTKKSNVAFSTPEDLYNAIVDLGTALGKKKVPIANRYVVIGWDALGLLCKDKRFTHNPDVLVNGIVNGQKINGMTIVVSANIADNTILAFYKGAVGFGQQIQKVEGLRLQDAFADGVRGLNVAGAAVLNPNGVASLTYTMGIESGSY